MIRNLTKKNIVSMTTERAESSAQKAKGLMFRKSMPEEHALLMEFGSEGKHGIWMLCMRFPIDIVYLDRNKKVISIVENARPVSINPFTWKIFHPERPARYVVELPAGKSFQKRIEKGDVLDL